MLVLVLINQASITIFRCIAAIFRAVVLANVMAFVYIVSPSPSPAGTECCISQSRCCSCLRYRAQL